MKTLRQNLPTCEQICFPHGIHLAILDTFASKKKLKDSAKGSTEDSEPVTLKSKYQNTISNMNKIINSFQRWALLCESLADYQQKDNTAILKIKTWCQTRWDSLLDSIENFLSILPQLTTLVSVQQQFWKIQSAR